MTTSDRRPVRSRPPGQRQRLPGRCQGHGGQTGQALTEAIVSALALLPLLLALPLLAKFQDVRLAAIAASRSAAFDCSVRFERCLDQSAQPALADDLRRRHFARHDRDVLSRDALAESPAMDERNRFWVDRRGVPLLASMHDVALLVEASESDAVLGAMVGRGTAARAVTEVAAAWSGLAGPDAFGLDPAGGLLTARVRARLGAGLTVADWLRRPDGLALALTGKTAVLTDAWNASSAEDDDGRSVRHRVDQGWRLPTLGEGRALLGAAAGFAPPGLFGALDNLEPEDAIDALYGPVRELITGPLLAPVEPRGSLFRYHEVDVDLVPQDRLGEMP